MSETSFSQNMLVDPVRESDLNSNLRSAILSSHLSQRELARQIGISHTYLADIMAGRYFPSEQIRTRLLQYFYNFRSEDLFGPCPPVKSGPDITCKRCQSARITKRGIYQGNQRYSCSDCGCVFIDNAAPLRGRLPLADLVLVMQRFFEGQSLESIRTSLADSQGLPVTLAGLQKIIDRYGHKAIRLASDFMPELGSFWFMDGSSLTGLYVVDIVDIDSGFIIASDVIPDYAERDHESILNRVSRLTRSVPGGILLEPGLLPDDYDSEDSLSDPVVLTSVQNENICRYQIAAVIRLELMARRLNFASLSNARLICEAWRINYNCLSDIKPAGTSSYNCWQDIINAPDPII